MHHIYVCVSCIAPRFQRRGWWTFSKISLLRNFVDTITMELTCVAVELTLTKINVYAYIYNHMYIYIFIHIYVNSYISTYINKQKSI